MSPLGLHISNWLASSPGVIKGKTRDEMWDAAHLASGLSKVVALDDFQAALKRAGYTPAPRTNGWVLCLPERFKGM